jgi:hypothetical protein
MTVQFWEYIQNHWAVHLKCVSWTACEFYRNGAVSKKLFANCAIKFKSQFPPNIIICRKTERRNEFHLCSQQLVKN